MTKKKSKRRSHKPSQNATARRGGVDIGRVGVYIADALDSILGALIKLGGVPPELPDESFDQALEEDEEYQAARVEYRERWKKVFGSMSDELPTEVLALEESINNLAVAAATVAWRMGALCGRADKK